MKPLTEYLASRDGEVITPKQLRELMVAWRVENMRDIPVELDRHDIFDYWHKQGVIIETADGNFRIDCKRPFVLDKLYDVRKRTAAAIAYYVEQDLEGDELLMKEVWEDCRTDEERKAAEGELRAILEWLNKRYPEKSRR